MPEPTTPLRVAIAEDSAVLREGLAQLLIDRGHSIAFAVPDASWFQDALSSLLASGEPLPDVSVIDIRMPPTHTDEGLRLALTLRAAHPGFPILLFSQYIETTYATDLLAGDASGIGYLLKDRVADVADFLDALGRVAAGGTALDPDVVSQLFGASTTRHRLDRLTPRETDVLALMAEGRSNQAIAQRLTVSEGAVEKHIAAILAKLDLPVSPDDHRRVLAVLSYLDT